MRLTKDMNAIRALFILALTLVATLAINTYTATAAPLPLRGVMMISSQEETDSARTTFYGFAPDDAELPFTATFTLPATYKLKEINELNQQTGPLSASARYTSKTKDLMTTYTVTLEKEHGFLAGFTITGNFIETQAMMGADAALVHLYYTPDTQLESLTLGFAAPEGMTGTGKDVVQIGTDNYGRNIFGLEFSNVASKEETGGAIAFLFANTSTEDSATSQTTNTTPWYTQLKNPTTMVIIATALVVLLVAILILVILRQRKRA